MFTMHHVCNVLDVCFDGEAPSRWAVIKHYCRASTRYGYPALQRTIRHGFATYGADGRSVVLTDKGREYGRRLGA